MCTVKILISGFQTLLELKKLILNQGTGSAPRVSVVEVPTISSATSTPRILRQPSSNLTPVKMSVIGNRTVYRAMRNFLTLNELSETHSLTFPLTTLEDFRSFDAQIADDLYKDLVSSAIFSKFIRI